MQLLLMRKLKRKCQDIKRLCGEDNYHEMIEDKDELTFYAKKQFRL